MKIKNYSPKVLSSLLMFGFVSSVGVFAYAQPYQPISLSPQVRDLRIVTDNEDAYRTKVELIRSARSNIKMSYYIFADDESSSYLARLLIEKAQNENVTTDILVDLHTNFKRWDLFEMLEREGQGKIRIRFFNRPSPTIIRDVTFITATCRPNLTEMACRAERKNQADVAYREVIAAMQSNRPAQLPLLTSAFLAGLYTKNVGTIKLAMALGTGKDIEEVSKLLKSNSGEMSADDKAQLIKLLQLIADAKLKGSTRAKIQLGIALATHGEQIQPILDMFDKIVPDTMQDDLANNLDWVHLTDFTHHKFLLIDGQALQMGGRNIENSYHMNSKNSPTDKYIFRDTDVVMHFHSPQAQLATSFDRIFSSRTLVADSTDLRKEMNFELVRNSEALGQLLLQCMSTRPAAVVECMTSQVGQILPTRQANLDAARDRLNSLSRAAVVQSATASMVRSDAFLGDVPTAELANAKISYIENIPFNAATPNQRLYFQKGKVKASNETKGIHQAVIDGIRSVCRAATDRFKAAKDKNQFLNDPAQQDRIIIHQGYVIFPGELLRVLGQTVALSAVNGSFDDLKCPGVQIDILTNSTLTTDLRIINVFAGHQIGTLLEAQSQAAAYYQQVSDSFIRGRMTPPARLRYFEFMPSNDPATQQSLHTKVFVLGKNRIIVGSANADVRSYFMDTNNALDIQNAPALVSRYSQWVDGQIQSSSAQAAIYSDLSQKMLSTTSEVSRRSNKGRLEYMTDIHRAELTVMVAEYEKSLRAKNPSLTPAEQIELDNKIKKYKEYIPMGADAIARINLEMYDLSQQIVKGEPDMSSEVVEGSFSKSDALRLLMEHLNLQFGLL